MKIAFSLILILVALNVSSQQVSLNNDAKHLPTSIYTSSLNKLPSMHKLEMNEEENLTTFEDVSLNTEIIKKEITFISTERLGKKSRKFFNEIYQEIAMNKAITSTFFDIDALYNLPRENPKKD